MRLGKKNLTNISKSVRYKNHFKPVEIDGVHYPSRRAAAEALNKNENTIGRWIVEGKANHV